jgi:hypothetical protein
MSDERVRVRLLFADAGTFHEQDMEVPAASLEGFDRLIDAFLEDPQLLKETYIDVDRLSAAWLAPASD